MAKKKTALDAATALASTGPSPQGLWVHTGDAKPAKPTVELRPGDASPAGKPLVDVLFPNAQDEVTRHMIQKTAEALADDRAARMGVPGLARSKAQADDLSRIIAAACDLVDALLGDASPILTKLTRPVTDKMRTYLDRRGKTSEDPWWVSKMRSTVARSDEKNVQLVDDGVFEVK